MDSKNRVRVRMAPSPTGFFHIGSARTALYNWLYARHTGGEFILRVEDTDVKRSSEDMIGVILEGMKWLGLDWKEIYYQSQRTALYKQHVDELMRAGKAYYCFCDPKKLEEERAEAYKKKINWQYDRRCFKLTAAERAAREKERGPGAVRFLVPDHPVTYHDIVHGDIKREAKDIEDFVVFRPDQTPTYNFACVIDDHDMGITHVIRGHDHITNTPKQVLLYESFGWSLPAFAHLPLILGKDKSKLSKRHGAVSIMEYKQDGFLPEAVFNYIALLGWSPGDNREIMNRDDMVREFTLERINSANAVFDIDKLEWMNQQYIMQLPPGRLLRELESYVIEGGLMTVEEIEAKRNWFQTVCNVMQKRLKVLGDIKKSAYFFVEDFPYDEALLKKHLSEQVRDVMRRYVEVLRSMPDTEYNEDKGAIIEASLKSFAENNGLKPRAVIHPLRVFISGTDAGPGLYEMMQLVGREKVIIRIERCLSKA